MSNNSFIRPWPWVSSRSTVLIRMVFSRQVTECLYLVKIIFLRNTYSAIRVPIKSKKRPTSFLHHFYIISTFEPHSPYFLIWTVSKTSPHPCIYSLQVWKILAAFIKSELKTLEWDILNPDRLINLEIKIRGEQALFNLEIKKKKRASILKFSAQATLIFWLFKNLQ